MNMYVCVCEYVYVSMGMRMGMCVCVSQEPMFAIHVVDRVVKHGKKGHVMNLLMSCTDEVREHLCVSIHTHTHARVVTLLMSCTDEVRARVNQSGLEGGAAGDQQLVLVSYYISWLLHIHTHTRVHI